MTVAPRRADAAASVGTYIALATANRVVAPCSKLAFADWWATTAGSAVGQDTGGGVGSPPVLGRDGSPGHRGVAAYRDRVGAADGHRVRPGPVRAGAGHDQLRHLHRLRQRPRPDRSARQSETETHGSAAGRVGVGGDPRRRGTRGVARLPRGPPRRHPIPHGHRGIGDPVPCIGLLGGVVDGGLRRRTKLGRQPRPHRRVRARVRRIIAPVRPSRPARDTAENLRCRRCRPLPRPELCGHRGDRVGGDTACGADPFPDPARRPVPRF